MKELLQKKTTKIGIAVIILVVAIGIISINARSAQKQREYDGHVEAAERYLTELDYEQAIAEYTLALEIEPDNEEVLNALEQTYLDYAQSLADAGEYEKAISVLEEGYAQTGRESLREKIEDVRNQQAQREAEARRLEEEKAEIIEFPFELTDITIMGYDLFGDHYEEVCAAYGILPDTDISRRRRLEVETPYGPISSSWVDEEDFQEKRILIELSRIFSEEEDIWHGDTWMSYYITPRCNGLACVEGEAALDLSIRNINIPVKNGDSYEELCRIMQVPKIKETAYEEKIEDTSEWKFQTKWGQAVYREWMWREEGKGCAFVVYDDNASFSYGNEIFTLVIEFNEDLVINEVWYSIYPGSF